MAIFTEKKDIEILKEGGRRLAAVLDEVIRSTVPGALIADLDKIAEKRIREKGDIPAFLHYTPSGAKRPYPATLCVSVNDRVVHGIPHERERALEEGDIVGLDIGLSHKKIFVDMAKTVAVGKIDTHARKLLQVTEEALYRGIKEARAGNRVGDIGAVMGSYVEENGFSIVKLLGGHGVGRKVHEDPYIPNFGTKGTGAEFVSGMALALEPIVNEGGAAITLEDDGYTYRTKDGKRSAHFEHTVLITEGQPIIITKI